MFLFVVAGAALALGLGLSLWTGRDGWVGAAGTAVFVTLAAYLAPEREVDGAGEPIDGAAGVALALLWVFVPWMTGILLARLIRRGVGRAGP